MSKYTVDSLVCDMRRLGINEGDTLLVRGDLSKIGKVEGKLGETVMEALFRAVGAEGTVIALAFTDFYFFPRLNEANVFDVGSPSNSGSLAKLFLQHPHAIRSAHPVNSFVAIGKHAHEIVSYHDETSSSYQPIEKLLELGGKMMLFGCVDNSPGFTTVHWAQYKLGLAGKSLLKGITGAYYKKGDKTLLFKRTDVGGCSAGFANFYQYYVRAGKLICGHFGNSYSIAINARDAYEIECSLLQNDPKVALCNDPGCFSCRGTLLYNIKDMPLFYLRYLPKLVAKFIQKKKGS